VPGTVVTVKPALTPTTETVAVTLVFVSPEAVTLTVTASPFATVPLALVNAPPLMAYSPSATEIVADVLIPVIVIDGDTLTLPGATSFAAEKLNVFGT
jgi:hypothetical protein